MTDKQIIYDDLEVSKCKHYNNGWCLFSESCDQIKYKSCHDMTLFDCYYKQLKRKEQECEFSNLKIIQLQETLSQYETDLSTKDCIIETCKAQYKELKAELEQMTALKDTYFACYHAKHEDLAKKYDQLKTENEEFKKDNASLYKIIDGKNGTISCFKDRLDELKAENNNIKETVDGLLKVQYELADSNKKLRQCLTEIKEVVEQEIVCDDCNLQGTNKCDSRLCTSFYLDDFCKSLLQKISEVENE